MIFSENRRPLFRIMPWSKAIDPRRSRVSGIARPRRCAARDAELPRETVRTLKRCRGFWNSDCHTPCAGCGNEGVGEHVRTRFHVRLLSPVKLRSLDPHRTKKTCFFCRTVFRRAGSFERTIQPFDLMSRRHPLSATRASWIGISFEKRNVLQGSCDVPASNRRQFS